ncbi:MAG: 3-isopropylmalate dehydratase [Candidatus Burarchaeum sp.]|nr:3-isopropylmalate dehydratase [Candidatus Burarchaeum sp.]MDO8339141.1 3-isopropylmalate dehydratase [Candidatus Burarchaeum sp.]
MGRAWKFGDNLNTDLITPGRYNMTTNAAELARVCFVEHRPDFAQGVHARDFVVGDRNFGCGSSRETAVIALKASGVRAVLAKSFARIFYRNCMNLGLLAIEMDTDGIADGEEVELDVESGSVRNVTRNEMHAIAIPHAMLALEREGGVVGFVKKNGFDALAGLFGK